LKLNVITLLIVGVALIWIVPHVLAVPLTPWRVAGIAIALPAFLLVVVSRIQLGGAFSATAKATVLVTSGIYSRIRNPIYVFSTIMLLGIIIWTGRPWLLLFLCVIVPMQIFRSRNEAVVLAEKFGDEYLAYKQRTWF
jgi:protein-S-isoprenylcysteine O-methyltransferase Ste14